MQTHTTNPTLNLLQRWQEAGYLRPIDTVFAGFLNRLEPEGSALVLLAGALTSYYYGQGHIGLNLANVLQNPATVLKRPRPEESLLEDTEHPVRVLGAITLDHWREALQASRLVARDRASHPLILEADHLYLTRNWRNEQDVAAAICRRAEYRSDTGSLPDYRHTLDQLFAPPGDAPNWQKIACALATRGRILIITGGPGTGKTYTVVRLLALLQGHQPTDQPLRILLAAPTGKAAARLTESIAQAMHSLPAPLGERVPAKAVTVHQLLGASRHGPGYRYHEDNPVQADVVVIDEASMIDLDMMAALLKALPETTRLILVGDKDQLASVEAGSVMGDLCHALDSRGYSPETADWIHALSGERVSIARTQDALSQRTVMLRDSRRFDACSGIGQLALAINAGEAARITNILNGAGQQYADLHWQITAEPNRAFIQQITLGSSEQTGWGQGFRHYLAVIRNGKPNRKAGTEGTEASEAWCRQVLEAFAGFQVLCAVREGPWGVKQINEHIAAGLYEEKLIGKPDGWYEGRPVIMTRNDYELGIMNGDVGISLWLPSASGDTLKVVFRNADGTLKMLSPGRLSAVETVYAMTVHKSQGSEFGHVVLILPDTADNPIATRELLYTGVTRARQGLTLIARQENDILRMAAKRIERSGRLGAKLSVV